jgi:hypothetical protein
MGKFILIVLLLVVPHCMAFGADTPDQRAIDAFLKTQDDKADRALNAQISALMKAGFKERGSTGAVLLSEGCGFVGCISTYLATTAYFTPGANRRSAIVAAIVRNPTGREFRVRRILTKAEIQRLANPK